MNPAITLRLQALTDLLHRYSAIFQHAWGIRKEMEPQPRLSHESQFLPAALELQETPVSPAPRIAMWLLIAFAGIALLWAIFGHIDMVATATGKIVPNDRSKVFGPVQTSRVVAIHVTDGQRVKAGDLLVELDPAQANADQSRFASDLMSARFQAARAKAMLAATTSSMRTTPCFSVLLRRALSTRIRRIASAAAAKKWRRLSKCWSPTSRRYASWTSAVASSV